jgi:mono/diheme cytochrome c family protein
MLNLAASLALLAAPADYLRDVKPVLAARCWACHGALQQKGGLRLDTADFIRKGGNNGPALVPGNSGESLIVQRVRGKGGRMPPPADGEHLKDGEVAALAAWIDAGARGPADEKPEPDPSAHWAFQPVKRPRVPASGGSRPRLAGNPIDAYLDARLGDVATASEAGRRILLRRVTLDLTGLPPTPEELAAFLADGRPDAYERVVERLLASPAHGERWGRHWMDVWRYSDWWGLGAEVRNSQKHIWHWRDWIVESMNADLGYDEMVRDMLAADERHPTDASRLRATGYLVRPYFKFNRNTWLEDVVEHTSKAFLGLTMNCAKCHDHKYDPIAQADFYRFRAFFEPYQVRMDLASDTDFERDGIPRVFDCDLERPTYLFVRGDEKNPKKKPIPPGLPSVLGAKLNIREVKLPPEAHSGIRPEQLAVLLRQSEIRMDAAREGLASARLRLAELEKPSPTPAAIEALVKDELREARPELWEAKSGKWSHAGGKLTQSSDAAARSALRLKKALPADFLARFSFTPTGGKTYRSVGMSFDVGEGSEVLVYLSAYASEPKLQVAFKRGTDYVYPPAGRQLREMKVGQRQDVVVRVRGTLINVEVNGQHALAYQLEVPRRPGAVELITYDATADFLAFEAAALPASERLIAPGSATATAKSMTPVQAKLGVAAAEKALAAALLRPASLRATAEAMAARTREKNIAASRAERAVKAAEAEEAVARAELELSQAPEKQKPAVEKKLTAARSSLAALQKKLAEESEAFTPLRGSLKTAESNVESEASRMKPFPAVSTGRRSALADWVTSRDNPLAARVAVNHLWLRHFGRPLVPTVFDFGRKGASPTHPELLDWLAAEFMDSGWSMKHLHRLIVTSAAYRRTASSAGMEASRKADPENALYWRMNSQRMEAQPVRDSLLSLADDLDRRMGGPPVQANADTRRRSMYFFHSHNEQNRLLEAFDDASVLECYRRSESILPQQALALSNSRLASQAAEKIAARIAARDDAEFARAAFELVLCQTPTADELAACVAALKEMRRSALVLALLNHNDFITIR